MNDALSAGFARLVGQKATEEEVRRLYGVRDALGLADNDALWLVLVALEHYEGLYREHPARIAEEARKALADVQRGFAAAAAVESKRAHRKLAEAVADAGIKIASKRTDALRWQGAGIALGVMMAFGSLCLSMGHALGSGRVPPWTHGAGARRLISSVLVLLCHKTRVRSSEWLGAAGGATGQEACQESCIEGAETGDGRGVVALRSNRESPAGGNLWVAERL